MASPDVPQGAAGRFERELKFELPEARVAFARRLIERWCRPDAQYPAATVSTIYFDTPDHRLLGRKIDSDYYKAKVRLRWYTALEGRGAAEGSFLEVKERIGALRGKVRTPTPLRAAWLEQADLQRPEITAVLALLRPLGVPVPSRLLPAVMLRYRRYRFVEPLSGARLSLDTHIEVVRAHPRLLPPSHGPRLPLAVLEVKGDPADLPPLLRPLVRLGARRAAVSKFALASRAILGRVW